MNGLIRVFFLSILLSQFSTFARSEVVFLPESRDQQYRTYGLYIDNQSTFIFKSAATSWGALGGSVAIAEINSWKWKPQFAVHGTANAAMAIISTSSALQTQTIDARAGLSFEFEFTEEFRGAVIWTHQSGHTSDEVVDADLIGSNLGNEIVDFRFIRDIENTWRLGVGFRPCVSSDPGMQFFGAEQFVEWFPLQFSDNPHHMNPFAAIGSEQYGRSNITESFHFQIGFAAGNHFLPKKVSSLRTVLGFYSGYDPRLKYFQMKHRYADFVYGGVMFEI